MLNTTDFQKKHEHSHRALSIVILLSGLLSIASAGFIGFIIWHFLSKAW